MKKLNIFLVAVLCVTASFAQTTILPYGAAWKYLDNGSDQGAAWSKVDFADDSWAIGNAELGYGDGDESTVVSYGSKSQKKYITTYFRKVVSINDPGSFSGFTLAIKRDDGAVVYVNGTEVFRSNMPSGTIRYTTKASTEASDDGKTAKTASLASNVFVNGDNTIAVEIHTARNGDDDISFDLDLEGFGTGTNIPPVANAGSDQVIILPTNSVTINGSGSTDGDGAITSYAWSQVSGPSSATIDNPGSMSTPVNGLVEGTYHFRLTVTDNDGASSTDDVVITVNATANIAPVANAGSDQSITLPTNSVTLNGNGSSDADGSITLYDWIQVSGPSTAGISSPENVSTSITGLVEGSYTFRLTVTDNDDATAEDEVVILVKATNKLPIASAGPDQTITLPTNSVTLNGSNSSDADGTITSYLWTKRSGPTSGTITSTGNVSTTVTGLVEGTYTFRLTVTDNDGATDANDMLVTVEAATSNTPPNASAGPDQTIILPTNSVTLDGSNSSDADGTITGYAWTKISGPSTFTITSPNNVSTTVTGLVAGTYTFRLTVTDNDGATDTNDMLVTVNAATTNTLPTANAGPDQTITLPTNSVTLNGSGSSDADGTITSYAWTKVSGPSTFTITSPNNVSTTITGLVAGTYTFRLTVTDNDGATDANDVVVTVASVTLSTLTRGPYLQMANGSAVTLRWRTDVATDSKISVGTSLGTYTSSATNSTSTTEHEVRISGLSADTKYYYSFGSSTETLQSGSANFFTTAPPASTTRKIGVAAFGDCGRNDNGFQSGSLSSYQDYVGTNPAELMLLLGDNAYTNGTDGEYSSNFFDAYSSSILKNHVLFPAPGNHDYANSSSRQADHNIPYYNIFTLPKAAECGGVASGTEAFYSYNWGNIHFLSLDSYGYEAGSTRLYDTSGPQVTWVKKDLAANTSKWTVVYWHHPPYTMGSHNSDTESDLVKFRTNFIRILERYGVDMVMCGHSHDYERSYLLKGYYGNEASFNVNTSAVTSSSGFYDGSTNSCPYNLKSGQVNHGTVYVVSGSAGANGSVQSGYPHNALPFAVDDGGMFYFEVENNRLDAKFIRKDGVIADKFTILKDAGQTSNVSIASGQSVTLTASWKGNYSWSTGAKTQSITVSPTSTTSYSCTDGSSCITDNFTVNVTSVSKSVTLSPSVESYTLNAYPTPVKKGNPLTIMSENTGLLHVNIFNDKGQKVKQLTIQGSTRVNTSDMRSGIYYLRTEIEGKKVVRKIMVIDN